jgi:putative DNA primase/helicase
MIADVYSPPASNLVSVLPNEMKALSVWLLWKAVAKGGKPKPDKVAYWANGDVRSGKQGSAKDIANLAPFERALAVYSATPGIYAGIGVALLPDLGVGALDLDDCLDANGQLKADLGVRRILKAAEGCYIERSPSGRGIRVFGTTDGFKQIAVRGFEAYAQGRFMTVTGDCVVNAGAWVSVDRGVAAMQHLVAAKPAAPLQPKASKKSSLPSESVPNPETTASVGRVRSALKVIDADVSYPDWLAVLMAIKSTGWDCAETLAREWSESGDKFTADSFTKAWDSIQPAGGVTLGTLFHMAKTAGWRAPSGSPLAVSPLIARSGHAMEEHRDILNGRIFAEKQRERILRVDQTGDVLVFDNCTGWAKADDPVNATRKAARETLASMSEAAVALLQSGNTEMSQKIAKQVAASSTLARMDAMAAVSWTHDGMTVSASNLNADPDLLGLPNGVLNLRKRVLTSFKPDTLITKRAGVDFAPDATAPTFEAFLEHVQPDPEVRRLLRQLAGLTLWGDPGVQRLFFFHGVGANGKTTFVEALCFVLGDYAVSIQAEALMRQERASQGPSPDTLRLHGARGAFASEVREGRLDEERVKLWTGGDILTARPVYGKAYVDFVPSHTFIMTGNHRPAIHDTGAGIWRRITLLEWGVQIPTNEQDPRLPEKLRREGSGILNWALDGLQDYWKSGLVIPLSVISATELYRTDEDIIGQFISEKCQVGHNLSCLMGDLFALYRAWAEGNHMRAATKNTFTRRLRDRGHPPVNSGREYGGIALSHIGAARYS